jgi:hypothetical protein
MSTSAFSGVFGLRLLLKPRVQRAALVVVLLVLLVARIGQFIQFSTQVQWGYDFAAYWQAGNRILGGEPLYAAFQTAGPYSPQQAQLYLYPPFLAAVVTPMSAAFDDYRVANWLWAAGGATILVLVVLGLSRRFGLPDRDALLLLIASFAFAPVVGELVMGNVHLQILGLLAGSWLLLDRGDRRGALAAGALIGIATLIKVFPGLLILWLLLTGRFQAALAAIVTMLFLVVATIPLTGIEPWFAYPTVLLNLGAPVDPRDVLAPAVWLADWIPSIVAKGIVAIIGLGIVVWATRRRDEPVSFAVAVAVSILVAPALYQHYLAVFALPLLFAVRFAPPVWWVAVAYLLMSGGEQEALGDWVWVVNRVLPTAGALLTLAALAWLGRAPSRTSTASASP